MIFSSRQWRATLALWIRSHILARPVVHAELLPELIEPIGGHIRLQLSPPALFAVHANVSDWRLLLNDLELPGKFLYIPFLILRELGIHRHGCAAHGVRPLCRNLTVIRLQIIIIIRSAAIYATSRTLISRLSLVRQVRLLSNATGRITADVSTTGLGVWLRIGGGGSGDVELASLVVHKFFGDVVNRARAIHTSKIISIKFALHARGSIGAVTSSTYRALPSNSAL